MNEVILSGPSCYEHGETMPTDLVILCHGYGSNGYNMMDLADFFAEISERPYFVAPNAPFDYEFADPDDLESPEAYQWYSLQDRNTDLLLAGSNRAAKLLNSFIDTKLAALGLKDENLILIGFSQGAMISLHTALRRTNPCKAVVSFSGTIIAPDKLHEEIQSRPKVCIVHGDEDDVVQISLGKIAHKYLLENNVPSEFHKIDGLDHSIDEKCIKIVNGFLKSLK